MHRVSFYQYICLDNNTILLIFNGVVVQDRMERTEKIRYDVEEAVKYVLEPKSSDSEMSELKDEYGGVEDESLEQQSKEQEVLELDCEFSTSAL